MKRSRLLLVVTTLAFAAWIGYLVYLTRTSERPSIVLSRPQFLTAEVIVIARLDSRDGTAQVKQVELDPGGKIKPGDTIRIKNLRESFRRRLDQLKAPEWDVPNDFILPLRDAEPGANAEEWTAEVAPLPPSPGLPQGAMIYPVTPSTMEQLQEIVEKLRNGA